MIRRNHNMDYKTRGTCSTMIHFDLDEDKCVHNLSFEGGCNGNLGGISKLVEGMPAQKVIDTLEGTRCGFKKTSCPDQLAKALKAALES